jgi:hypothetical protein
LPGAELIASLPAISGSVKESSARSGADARRARDRGGILDLSMEKVGWFIGEPAAGGVVVRTDGGLWVRNGKTKLHHDHRPTSSKRAASRRA